MNLMRVYNSQKRNVVRLQKLVVVLCRFFKVQSAGIRKCQRGHREGFRDTRAVTVPAMRVPRQYLESRQSVA